MRGSRILPWTVPALIALVMLAAEGVHAARDGIGTDNLVGLAIMASLIVPAGVGAGILTSLPGHRVGWIMLLGPVVPALLLSMETYAGAGLDHGMDPLPGAAWAAGIASGMWPGFYVWPVALALVFPDGCLPSPRWRPVAVAAFAAPALVAVGAAMETARLHFGPDGLANPVHVPESRLPPGLFALFYVALFVMLATLFAGAAAMTVRYRRSTGVERLQLKWLAWSVALVPIGLLVCWASYALVGQADGPVLATLLAAGVAVSVAVGVAITRHGLYEIDRIVNRTLVYVCLTAVLAGGVGVVVLVAGVVVGRGSPWGTAAATFAVAVAFRPVRDRIQQFVDRRFARDRYAGLRAVQEFEQSVRAGAVEPERIGDLLARALDDPTATLLVRLPATGVLATLDGGTPPDTGARVVTPVHRRGEQIAALVHAPTLRERPDTLRSIVGAAGLPIEIARLRAEVRLQLAAVEASRERLVRAGDEERRRLERDLHDGAQQRLVGLGVALRRMQRSLPREARVLGPALEQAVAEVGRAIADLRTIAAGLRPPRLDDGLAAALGDLARSSPVPVRIDLEHAELAPAVEVAAYYAVCEAVTNAVKHARAGGVDVTGVRDGARLVLRVRDDGVGGARPGTGSGLTGIADRVGAHGGTVRVESPVGNGTLVEVELPCAS